VAAEGLDGAMAQLWFDRTLLRILRYPTEVGRHLSQWMLPIKLEDDECNKRIQSSDTKV
jgi:hypothetical protein